MKSWTSREFDVVLGGRRVRWRPIQSGPAGRCEVFFGNRYLGIGKLPGNALGQTRELAQRAGLLVLLGKNSRNAGN